MSYSEFRNTFVEWEKQTDVDKEYYVVKDNVNIDYLYSLIAPYVFEAKLKTNINKNDHIVDYTCYDTTKYYRVKQEMLNNISYMGDVDFLAMTQKMQHSYSLDYSHVEACRELVNSLSKKTIIFCKFVDTKELLKKEFPECKVLTYGKGSLGLNLQEYKNIVFYEKTWDYAQLEQAKRRIYRLGQSEDVNYYFLTGDMGLEKLIDNSIENKLDLLNMFKQSSNKKEFANEF